MGAVDMTTEGVIFYLHNYLNLNFKIQQKKLKFTILSSTFIIIFKYLINYNYNVYIIKIYHFTFK